MALLISFAAQRYHAEYERAHERIWRAGGTQAVTQQADDSQVSGNYRKAEYLVIAIVPCIFLTLVWVALRRDVWSLGTLIAQVVVLAWTASIALTKC